MRSPTVILQVTCPDRAGLVSELSGWVAANGGNIRHADHHTDAEAGLFLSRIEWDLDGFGLPGGDQSGGGRLGKCGSAVMARFPSPMPFPGWRFLPVDRSTVWWICSWRTRAGELPMQVALVISNHPPAASRWLRPTEQGSSTHRLTTPAGWPWRSSSWGCWRSTASSWWCWPNTCRCSAPPSWPAFPAVINIHHSFLPAFQGAQPYQRAWQRGVKLIGATAHLRHRRAGRRPDHRAGHRPCQPSR